MGSSHPGTRKLSTHTPKLMDSGHAHLPLTLAQHSGSERKMIGRRRRRVHLTGTPTINSTTPGMAC